MAFEPAKFLNHYKHCGQTWSSTWSCMCNDECPSCSAEIEPVVSEELCLECGANVDDALGGKCPECEAPIKDFDALQLELV